MAVGDACSSDLDCVAGDFCNSSYGVCVKDGTSRVGDYCNDDRDCVSGDFCDGANGTCVTPAPGEYHAIAVGQECRYDDECETGAACDYTGVCETDGYSSGSEDIDATCYDDPDCQSGYCDQTTDTCV